ncbi:COMPONENT OF OLIGOMERIC GOLGI COMPLEX 6 [Salix viminalis]|uniref:COMPONENT OF OLIGOMERIC GOLGI COMPLEX 6 n=1 Tax=Salix viminalis TaxID=40686 RepID=A0A9Q0YZL6_SALVM|nr:COMPONENT OF OLIGOMERIC GOLGI COMPLEX 6 [Salix viminalis]
MIENHMHSLVEKEVEAILSRCGLSQKMHYFQKSLNEEGRTAAGTPLVEIEDTSPVSLSECLRAFFGLILGNESSLPEFELMQVPKLRSEAGVQVARAPITGKAPSRSDTDNFRHMKLCSLLDELFSL